ncbi:MAG: pyruvate formate-lyase 1-activating enzyme [Alteromonadaceae bacterium]|nr:MAG: pyruvate formate-lyase 1-activating enzyme [Alteromonadaceae bacterium]
MLGHVHSLVAGSVVDGPGIRYVIFLQGCQFRCQYCHNRDTWDMREGKLYSVAELVDETLKYTRFFDRSHGGVTVTGGEALLQATYVDLLFKQLHKMDIHTCLDTNGYASPQLYRGVLDSLLDNTDLVLLDIKQMDPKKHLALTEVDNERTLTFAKHLAEREQTTRIRYVVVPGFTDDLDDIRQMADFIAPMKNIERVELLPYHAMGEHKWQDLGFDYPLKDVPSPTAEKMQQIKSMLEIQYGFRVLL